MHFLFFYCFAVTKKLQKIQTVLKKEEEEYMHGKQTYSNKQLKVWDLLKYLDHIEIKWVI